MYGEGFFRLAVVRPNPLSFPVQDSNVQLGTGTNDNGLHRVCLRQGDISHRMRNVKHRLLKMMCERPDDFLVPHLSHLDSNFS